jgi:hypothetical protein
MSYRILEERLPTRLSNASQGGTALEVFGRGFERGLKQGGGR